MGGEENYLMLVQIIVIIALVSILLAMWSITRQKKLDEITQVKEELHQNKIIFQSDSSKTSSDLA